MCYSRLWLQPGFCLEHSEPPGKVFGELYCYCIVIVDYRSCFFKARKGLKKVGNFLPYSVGGISVALLE